ncbi:hypothetical protein [Antrihabitans sp. YC2-6]|uniref:hypothetical protein n=1 Tax=Antrihabitans sp. YC2-6 TaxID=2799498 RepID=UPI0018F48E04|nr:hypothetical protein [Antrihabitans sp. YC2-6]MBJ8347713.1 hypothetical protein [Antrihabitans sp. YC2-6]
MRNKAIAALVGTVGVALVLSGCSSQEKDFRKQLESNGMSVSSVHEVKTKSTSKSTKRAKRSSKTKLYEAEVKFGANGQCVVEFEQGKGETRYYLDEVNNAEPAVGIMKDNPTKADVEAYLRGPDSPCKI